MRSSQKYTRNDYIQPKQVELNNIELDVTANDKSRLKRFIKEETNYYNRLVEGFSPLIRSFPDLILECDDAWQKIFGYVAESKISLRKYLNRPNDDIHLPGVLEIYKIALLSSLTERKVLLTDIATAPGVLLPIVRRNMAVEFLKFYQEQASKILTPAANHLRENGDTYKTPPEVLESMDYDRKRHLQIPKQGLLLNWNASCNATEIKTGYTASPICVPKINLLVEMNWNYVVLREASGLYSGPPPWVIDVKKISNNYLLKYFDSKTIREPT